jgi:hypothetical protein
VKEKRKRNVFIQFYQIAAEAESLIVLNIILAVSRLTLTKGVGVSNGVFNQISQLPS